MAEEGSLQKPLIQQVLDDMFAVIKEREEFDPEMIEKLKRLAETGDLKKPSQVMEAIKRVPEERDEST